MFLHFIRKLARDCSGVGFIELALTAPLLALLFLGMIDLSSVVSTRIDLEQAAQRTTDYALAKRPPNGNTSYLVNEASTASGVPSSDIVVELILECDGTRQSSFTGSCTSGQVQKRFVSVAISKSVSTGFNWRALGAMFNGGNSTYSPVRVTGDSLVRLQ